MRFVHIDIDGLPTKKALTLQGLIGTES